MEISYYDHEKNSGPVNGSAMARASKAAAAAGDTYRVEFTVTTGSNAGKRFWYAGNYHGVLGLAKSLQRNLQAGYADVVLTDPKGRVLNIQEARF